MVRTPTVTREQVPEELRAAFDAETASTGGVVAGGPGSVMIHSPEMRRRANSLVNYLRDESSLPKKIQELAMIITARSLSVHLACPRCPGQAAGHQRRVRRLSPRRETPAATSIRRADRG